MMENSGWFRRVTATRRWRICDKQQLTLLSFVSFLSFYFWSLFREDMTSVAELNATAGTGKVDGDYIGGLELGGGFKEKNGLLLGV